MTETDAYHELYVHTMGRPAFILQHVVDANVAQTASAASKPIGVIAITPRDVMAAPAGSERDAAIDRWCQSVWNEFLDSRDIIVRLLEEYGIAPASRSTT